MQEQVAIIGAGLAGATLAHCLSKAGHQVTVLEKSRGTGGRMAACRLGQHSADLGAPWFVPRSPAFTDWLQRQGLHQWSPTIRDFSGNPVTSRQIWLAGPRQSALTRQLLEHCNLITETRVSSVWPELENSVQRIVVRTDHDQIIGYYDKVIVTAPAQQAVSLLDAIPRFSGIAARASTQPCWVTVISTPQSHSAADIYCGDHPMLQRCIRDNSKPQRDGDNEVWVLEANSEWSQQMIDASPEDVVQALISSFREVADAGLKIDNYRSHRWLLARHSNDTELTHLWDQDTGIGACGDWLAEAGLEGSWISANSLAEQMLSEIEGTVE